MRNMLSRIYNLGSYRIMMIMQNIAVGQRKQSLTIVSTLSESDSMLGVGVPKFCTT